MPSPAILLRLAISLLLAGVSTQAGAGFIVSGADTSGRTLSSGTGESTSTGTLSVSGSTNAVTVTGTSNVANSRTLAQTGSSRGVRVTANNIAFSVVNADGAYKVLRKTILRGNHRLALIGGLVLRFSWTGPGESFNIVLNNGVDPIIGRFAQGDRITASFGGESYAFTIDYVGDQSSDVRLVAVPSPGTLCSLGLGVLGAG